MSEKSFKPVTPLSVEEGVNVLLTNAQQHIRAVGYCLHRLPVRSLLVAQVRLLSALAPPALFVFGAAKVYEFLQRQELAKHS